MRRFLFLLLMAFAALTGALLIAPFVVDLDSYRGDIAREATRQIGRDIEIEGGVDLFLLPAPGIRVGRLRVANAPGFAGADALTLRAAEADVALLPLLRGEIHVNRVRLVAPVLNLERRADGVWNWAKAPASDAAPRPTGEVGAAGARVRIADLTVEEGSIVYRDAADGTWAAEAVAARLVAEGMGGPVRGRIDARVGGRPVRIEGRVGRLDAGGPPAPVSIVLGLADGDGVVKVDGRLAGGLDRPRFSGRMLADVADLGATLAALSLPVRWPATLSQAAHLSGEIAATREGASLNDLKVAVADMTLSGAASVRFGADPRADVALAMTRLDLDAWWPAEAATQARAPAFPSAPSRPAALTLFGPTFPIGLDLGINAVVIGGGTVRGVKLALEWQGAGATVEELRAEFPGAALATAFGTISQGGDGPSFEGRVEAVVDNLRALLQWRGLDPLAVPADRLRSLSLAAGVSVDGAGASVSDLDLRLDSSRLTGTAGVQWRDRRFDADLAVDRVNLDAYLPAPVPASMPAAVAPAATEGAAPWAALTGWEGRVLGRIAALTYRDTLVQDIGVDAASAADRLTLHGASARVGSGARAQASGEVTLAGTPEFRLSLALVAQEAATLARLAGLPADSVLTRLRPFDLKGSLAGNASAVAIDLETTLGGTHGEVKGSIADPAADDPGLDLDVDVRDGDLAALLAALDLADWPLAGPGTLRARLKGPLSGSSIAATLEAADLAVTAEGRGGLVDGNSTVDLNMVADHPRFTRLLGALRRDARPAHADPAHPDPGPFHAAGRLAGDATEMRLTGLDLRFGPTVIRGDASLAQAGARPRLTATLNAGDVILDPLLPPPDAGDASADRPGARGAGSGPPPSEAERWSAAQLALDGLRRFDARVQATMRSIVYGAYRIDGAELALGLDDGVLAVERLEGVAFKGQGRATLRLTAAEPATLDLALALTDADLGLVLRSLAAVEEVSGGVTIDGAFRSQGASVRDLVAALSGDLRIAGGKGAIAGVDLRGLSDQLHRLDGVGGFAGLLQAGMSGGQTRLDSLVGTVAVRDGVATTEDMVLWLDGGEGRAVGRADLSHWRMDLTTMFRLVEHPQAPPIGVRLRGPLDAPEREVQSDDLEAYFTRRLVGGVMRRLLPGEVRGSGLIPAPAAPLRAPAPNAEQSIKDIMKSLGR